MFHRFCKTLSKNFCIYLLAGFNLIYAIINKSYDWLLWVSVGLVVLSLILNLISVAKGDDNDA